MADLRPATQLDAPPRRRTMRAGLLLVACLVAALLAQPAPASAAKAAPKDPVLVAISRAKAAKQLTYVEARDLTATWTSSARAVKVARKGSRRDNVIAVRAYTTNLARSGGLTAERMESVLLSVRATTLVMLTSPRFPAHEGELRIPDEDVVFTYYSGRGVQVQPFETLKEGMRQLNQLKPQVEQARAIADRMLELGVVRGDSLVWEYHFAFNGPARPWTSAISQALATEFFFRLAALVPEAERQPYLDAAAATTRSFLRSTAMGGVASTQGDGSFYVMYSFNPSQRILNGHLQSLLNVNRYALSSGSAEAKLVVDRGLTGVLPILPKFDTGAWSNYQPGQEAELGYHEFQSEQLVKLGKELANPTFADYGDRFTEYMITPATLTFGSTAWLPIIPARDGFRDTITVPFTVDKRAKVSVVIKDSGGTEVRRLSTSRGRGSGTLVWDGRTSAGITVPDGDYSARITTTDIVGNRGFIDVPAPLVVTRDVEAPVISSFVLRDAGKATVLTVKASDVGSAWIDASVRLGGAAGIAKRGARFGTITIKVNKPINVVRQGTLELRDSSGNVTRQPLAPAGD